MKKKPTDIGLNRTGVQMSPIDMQTLIDAARSAKPTSAGDETTLAEFRASYFENAEPNGTVPLPGTLKGASKSGLQKLKGKKPEVLIDKLGERLAFERTGTRLYEAFLSKCEIRPDEVPGLPIEELRQFQDEEEQHFSLVAETLLSLGADPTAVTPSADATSVAGMGWVQVVCDPATSVAQSMQVIQIAELADYDGWELLIKLTDELGMDEITDKFRQAWSEEEHHLERIRELMAKTVLTEAGVA